MATIHIGYKMTIGTTLEYRVRWLHWIGEDWARIGQKRTIGWCGKRIRAAYNLCVCQLFLGNRDGIWTASEVVMKKRKKYKEEKKDDWDGTVVDCWAETDREEVWEPSEFISFGLDRDNSHFWLFFEQLVSFCIDCFSSSIANKIRK